MPAPRVDRLRCPVCGATTHRTDFTAWMLDHDRPAGGHCDRGALRAIEGDRARPAPRSRPIVIRLTPEEWERFDSAAKAAGNGLGPWLRMLASREARRHERQK
jgi:hypothetical protein